jgi:hypothetical protein
MSGNYTRMKVLTLVVPIFALVFRVTAQDTVSVTGADVTEAGVYTAHIIKKYDAPGVVGGTMHDIDSLTLLQAATNVPARVATRFGFRYTIHGTPLGAPIVLTVVGEHPPVRDPKSGQVRTRDEFKLQSWIDKVFLCYRFDEQWEAVPGKWKFEVWHEGKKLCEQSFTVVPDAKTNDEK